MYIVITLNLYAAQLSVFHISLKTTEKGQNQYKNDSGTIHNGDNGVGKEP